MIVQKLLDTIPCLRELMPVLRRAYIRRRAGATKGSRIEYDACYGSGKTGRHALRFPMEVQHQSRHHRDRNAVRVVSDDQVTEEISAQTYWRTLIANLAAEATGQLQNKSEQVVSIKLAHTGRI